MISLGVGERLDDLNLKGCHVIQNTEKFCFGVDAVLLSEFAVVKEGDSVLDLGTGTGIIPILLEAKTNGRRFVGLEIQAESVEMAVRSVEYNNQQYKVNIVEGDIKEASAIFGNASFEVVTVNPPYMSDLHGIQNPKLPKAIARHEILCTLHDVVRESAQCLKEKGRFYMIHRPHRLSEIFAAMHLYKIEPKRMRMVHSFHDREASMVLIEGIKGGRAFMKVDKPLIIYREPGIYTEELDRTYVKK